MRTGTRIRLAREAQEISREDLAKRSGIPFSTLVKIEQGVIADPKLVDVIAIAGVLGGDCRDFAPNDEPEPGNLPVGRPPDDRPKPAPKRRKRGS
jgi:transcriptional regulator with XRE-family HTH domain